MEYFYRYLLTYATYFITSSGRMQTLIYSKSDIIKLWNLIDATTHLRSSRGLPFNIWVWVKSAEPTFAFQEWPNKRNDDSDPPPPIPSEHWNSEQTSDPPERQRWAYRDGITRAEFWLEEQPKARRSIARLRRYKPPKLSLHLVFQGKTEGNVSC